MNCSSHKNVVDIEFNRRTEEIDTSESQATNTTIEQSNKNNDKKFFRYAELLSQVSCDGAKRLMPSI